jgi:hypothetical protein
MKDQKFTKSLTFLLSILLILYFGSIINVEAQEAFQMPGPVSHLTLTPDGKLGCQLHLGDAVAHEHHSISGRLESPSTTSNGRKSSSTGANIIVQYFNFDPFFPQDRFIAAATAFQSAVDAWAISIDTDEPIFVAAVFQPLGEGVLGSAGPTRIYANYNGMERDSWYGNALADKLAGEDLDPTLFDIVANFSTVFPNWYFGTDGNTPANDYDFKTVVLHELCHGLGFFGSMTVDNFSGIGSYGFGIPDPTYPAIYDRLHSSPDNKSILKDNRYPNFSVELGDALLSGTLNAKGPRIKKATNGKGAEMFTTVDSEILGFEIPGLTDIWLPGSSYSHVDFFTYAGGPDGLMVPFISTGLSYSNPGELTLAIFDDIGWNGKVNREVNNGRIAQNEFDEIIYQQNLKVYPNPVDDNLAINLEAVQSSLISAILIDAMGRNIGLNISRSANNFMEFDLTQNSIKPGAYVLRLQFENQQTANIRLLKN